MNRRTLLLGAALAPLAASRAFGQAGWPDRLLRIVVPFAPGSFTDISARLVANELAEQLGQSVIVENRGGAGGTAGTTAVVRAAPDGYTLLLTDTSLSISPGLYPNLPYDPVRDLAQISRIADLPSILLVRPGLGPRTLAELVALAKQKPERDHLRLGRPGIVRASGDGAAARTSPASGRCTCRSAAWRRRSPRWSPAASTWRSRAWPPAWRMCRPARCSASACPARSAAPCCRRCRRSPRPASRAYDMSYWWGIAAPAGTPPPTHRAAQPRDRARLRAAAAARGVPQAGRRRRHVDAAGDDAASRARDRGLARGDRARQGPGPVAHPDIQRREPLSHQNEAAPAFRAPPLSCDAHFHVFGPAERYPYGSGTAEKLRYAPPLAPLSDFLELAALLGFERFVFVQPSAYGRDNACMLDAMREVGIARCRGIVDVDENAPDALLAEMDGIGVRGVRVNVSPVAPLAPGLSETMRPRIERLDARCAELGWHLDFLGPGWLTEELLPIFATAALLVHRRAYGHVPRRSRRGPARLPEAHRSAAPRPRPHLGEADRDLSHGDRPGLRRRRADGARADRDGARPADLGQRLSAPLVRRPGGLGAAVQPLGRLGAGRSRRAGASWSTIRPRCSASEAAGSTARCRNFP